MEWSCLKGMSETPHWLSFDHYMLVVAHPDDAEFSSAGLMARLTDAGKEVTIVQVTSGDKGTPDADVDPGSLVRRREAEELEAARRLGVQRVEFLHCTDGELIPDLTLREKVVRQIRKHRPDVVVAHDPYRPYALHPDHRAVGFAAVDSVYPTARDPQYFPEHLKEGLQPHKTAEIWFFNAEHPDLFVDITEVFDRKIDALRAHESQVGTGPEFAERVRDRAREVAVNQPFELAEAFKIVQMRR
jgi:LmbE family N-acetylglucosaminyl deacetylase